MILFFIKQATVFGLNDADTPALFNYFSKPDFSKEFPPFNMHGKNPYVPFTFSNIRNTNDDVLGLLGDESSLFNYIPNMFKSLQGGFEPNVPT